MIPNIHSLARYCERHSWGREFCFFLLEPAGVHPAQPVSFFFQRIFFFFVLQIVWCAGLHVFCVLALVLLAVGVAWPNRLAVSAMCICLVVSWPQSPSLSSCETSAPTPVVLYVLRTRTEIRC